MYRYLIAALFCLGWLTQSGRGDPFQPIVGLPHSYVPGEPVIFDVRLPSITNLGATTSIWFWKVVVLAMPGLIFSLTLRPRRLP